MVTERPSSRTPWPQVGFLTLADADTRTVFLAGRPGWILTAAHGLPAEVDLVCAFPRANNGYGVSATAILAFVVGDIAVLRIKNADSLLPRGLRMVPRYEPRPNDHYETWGFRPVDESSSVSLFAEGSISGVIPDGLDGMWPLIQIRTDTQRPGMSGAPIVIRRSRSVVGVATGRRYSPDPGDQEPLAFAQPVDTLPVSWWWHVHGSQIVRLRVLVFVALVFAILSVVIVFSRRTPRHPSAQKSAGQSLPNDPFRNAALESGRPHLFDAIWMHVIYDPSVLPNRISLQVRIFYTFEVLRPTPRFDEYFPAKNNLVLSTTWAGTDSFISPTNNPNPHEFDVPLPPQKRGDRYSIATGIFRTFDWPTRERTAFGPDGPQLPAGGEWAGYPNREDFIRELIVSVEVPAGKTTGYGQLFRGKPGQGNHRIWHSEPISKIRGGIGAPDMYVARARNVVPGDFLGLVFEFTPDAGN